MLAEVVVVVVVVVVFVVVVVVAAAAFAAAAAAAAAAAVAAQAPRSLRPQLHCPSFSCFHCQFSQRLGHVECLSWVKTPWSSHTPG